MHNAGVPYKDKTAVQSLLVFKNCLRSVCDVNYEMQQLLQTLYSENNNQ